MSELKAPFPYFGGKRSVASDVWKRLGRPTHLEYQACSVVTEQRHGDPQRSPVRALNHVV